MKLNIYIRQMSELGKIDTSSSIHTTIGPDYTLEQALDSSVEKAEKDGFDNLYLYINHHETWETKKQVENYLKEYYTDVTTVPGGYSSFVIAYFGVLPKRIDSLHYKKGRNSYESSTKNCTYYVDSKKAYSYNWWLFCTERKGKIIFNDYNYSNTTTNHQWSVKNVLTTLGLKSDICIQTHQSLDRLDLCAIELESNILKTLDSILKPGTRATTNSSRLKRVNALVEQIKALKTVMNVNEKANYKEKSTNFRAKLKSATSKVDSTMEALRVKANKPKKPVKPKTAKTSTVTTTPKMASFGPLKLV